MWFVGSIIVQLLVDVWDPLSFESRAGWGEDAGNWGGGDGVMGKWGSIGEWSGNMGWGGVGGDDWRADMGDSWGGIMGSSQTGPGYGSRWASDDGSTVNWGTQLAQETSVGTSHGDEEDGYGLLRQISS